MSINVEVSVAPHSLHSESPNLEVVNHTLDSVSFATLPTLSNYSIEEETPGRYLSAPSKRLSSCPPSLMLSTVGFAGVNPARVLRLMWHGMETGYGWDIEALYGNAEKQMGPA